MLISRAHRGAENQEDLEEHQRKNHKGPRSTFAQFTNWRVADEISNKIVMHNAKKQTKVVVNQMFSKDLTFRRNNALKRRHQRLNNANNNLQIKLIFTEIHWHCELKSIKLEQILLASFNGQLTIPRQLKPLSGVFLKFYFIFFSFYPQGIFCDVIVMWIYDWVDI